MKKTMASLVLALALLLFALPALAATQVEPLAEYDLSKISSWFPGIEVDYFIIEDAGNNQLKVTLNEDGDYMIVPADQVISFTGDSESYFFYIKMLSGAPQVLFNNAAIHPNCYAVFIENANPTMTFMGDNTLTTLYPDFMPDGEHPEYWAAIDIFSDENAVVTFKGSGTLNLKGGMYGVRRNITKSQPVLTIDGDLTINAAVKDCKVPGIGGDEIVIQGGTITANGGLWSAGIGGNGSGYDGGSGGPVVSAEIIINDGVITAVGGESGAGIGGAWGGTGTVTINGGVITAIGGESGAGIGGGEDGDGIVTINGGIITAIGGKGGVGIGGGKNGDGTVTINGGTITAIGGDGANSIGCGEVTIYVLHSIVKITGGSVNASGFSATNGSVPVSQMVLSIPELAADRDIASITDLPSYYGLNDVRTIDGKLYLWLPEGSAYPESITDQSGITYVHTGNGVYSNQSCAHDYANNNGFCKNCGGYEPVVLSSGVYQISNAGQLMWFAEKVNDGRPALNAVLTDDIDMNGVVWAAMGRTSAQAYTGTFDGQGHTISNLNCGTDAGEETRASFVYYLGAGGRIENVTFDKASVFTQGHANANASAVVALRNAGTISRCIVSNATVQLGNYEYLAGIAGINENGGVIEYCAVINTALTRRYGRIRPRAAIVQQNNGTVRSCYAYGCTYNNEDAANGGIISAGNAPEDSYYYTTASVAATYGTVLTPDQFASGEAAYKLNGSVSGGDPWRQTCGTGLPALTGSKVYCSTSCANKPLYTNDASLPAHPGWTYTAQDLTITAVCTNGCGETLTLTLKPPADKIYDEKPSEAAVIEESMPGVLTYTVRYVDAASSEEYTSAPSELGDYRAILEAGGVSVQANFSIVQALGGRSAIVRWVNYDRSLLEMDRVVPFGETPEYNGETPVRAADAQYVYIFTGWDPAIVPVDGNATYTAQFASMKAVRIVSPTEDQTVAVYEGAKAEMSITAQNAVRYQWYVDYNDGTGWHAKQGATGADCVTAPVRLENTGYRYFCIAYGENDAVYAQSPVFVLEVLKQQNLPDTGDNSSMGLWLALCAAGLSGLSVLLRRRKNAQ